MASENGWIPAWVGKDSLEWTKVPGTNVTLQIQKGQPLQILRAFAADYNAYVEPLRDHDSASYTPTNSVRTSNHLNGTAMDLNWNGADGKTFRLGISEERAFPNGQAARVRELLDWYEGMIFNGGKWSIRDWMHFQLGGNTYNNPKTADFIRRKIRPDGFSTFKRGAAGAVPGGAVPVLAEATGLSLQRAGEIAGAVADGLKAADCTNSYRIAMWLAQIGHESGGFRYTEEIASGAAYEGRTDLGNTQPGDGVRFKGRSWIQITGRSNYTQFSKWAFSKGLTPSELYFVEDSKRLAELKWAGVGAAWYWTVARRDINSLSDARDLRMVTYRINGGYNGLADRTDRYNRADKLKGRLLELLGGGAAPEGTVEELLMSSGLYESLSLYKEPGEGPKLTLAQMIQSIDGMRHRESVEDAAMLGSFEDIDRIVRVAKGEGHYKHQAAINHARLFLVKLERENPQVLESYLAARNGE